jgi:RNA polymerase sigma-70 factor (sigma-E family)
MTPADGWGADEAVAQVYAAHYASLVRMAALLVRNSGEAEEIVQDAFVAMHGRWHRLRQPENALAYIRQSVVNRARSLQRRHSVADRHLTPYVDEAPAADSRALDNDTRAQVMDALHALPTRQREVLVLRYYSELSEAEISAALGISRGAVKSHASRGMTALRKTLEDPR